MTSHESISLEWSTQLRVKPASTNLQGDKIKLPSSALEQLLSASTVTQASANSESPTSESAFDPYSYSRDGGARAEILETQQKLPHPLTFRLVNPANGNVAYAGVREFSAEENEVAISGFLLKGLGFEEDISDEALTVHAQQLPKGTYVRLRPLEAGYDAENWRALLERHMRNTFTTLTKGETFSIPSGKEEYRFLIDEISPEGDAICIIDTDLEVDIEALNEEQARETLKRRLEKNQIAPGGEDGSSRGGIIVIEEEVAGKVLPGDYIDYTLEKWDRSQDIEVELDTAKSELVDFFVSPLTSRQRNRPRETEHVLADVSGSLKKIRLSKSYPEFSQAEAVYISVHGYAMDEEVDGLKQPIPTHFTLRTGLLDSTRQDEGSIPSQESQGNPDESQCKNCLQWVPKRTMVLHESFCYRNNVFCPKCHHVFQKSSDDWKSHWHCSYDASYGNTPESQQKHHALLHTPRTCMSCGYQTRNTMDLARHRTSTCPEKPILCQFCHLLVPQQGPDDLSWNDPEVILSGLTPHELSDGARTTECHLCSKIVRLRDMAIHLRHHDLERLSRARPRLCRNVNCGRALGGVGPKGEPKHAPPSRNDIGLCDPCFGPLYISTFDPELKALRRRIERRYLTQFLTGCGNDFCRNEYCRTARQYLGLENYTSKEAMGVIKPILDQMVDGGTALHFCTDEPNQKRRLLAEMVAAEPGEKGNGGYDVSWCVAALENEGGDLGKARTWLENWAPTRAEAR